MNPEEILLLLEGIGAMLSPTAEKVWVITLHNAVLQGYINLAWAIIAFIGALVSVGIGCLGLRANDSWDEERVFTVLGFVGAVVCILAFIPLVTAAVSYLSVPEYRAMQNLMNMLRGAP